MKKLLHTLTVLLTVLSASAENYIHYTSSDGKIVIPENPKGFGANIISNTYENGQGKILFDGEVTKIGMFAFSGDEKLTSIEIPNSVTYIGAYAFEECYVLKSVKIGDAVSEFGESPFIGCLDLESFTGKFASEDNRCLIVDGVLIAFAPAGISSYNIPDHVTEIGGGAFDNCEELLSVVIPNSVIKIDVSFMYCTSLTSVVIGSSVTEIGYKGFLHCPDLREISSLNVNPPSLGLYCFDDEVLESCIVKVPSESVKAYKNAKEWKDFQNIVALTDEEYIALGISSPKINTEKGGDEFNIYGQPVSKNYYGVVIRDGKKVFRK